MWKALAEVLPTADRERIYASDVRKLFLWYGQLHKAGLLAKKEEKKAEMKKEEKKEMSPQQKKMADCSSESKGLKGDEYKKKHAACMKGEKPAAAKDEKKTKLAECSSQAKGLKGDEYKKKRDDCMAK